MMKVVICGSSGLVGSFLLEELLRNKEVERIYSLSRKPSRITHKKLIEIETDFEQLVDLGLPETIDMSFCALGTTLKKAGSKEQQTKIDKDYVVEFAKFCLRNGGKQIGIISSLGANPESSNFYLRLKGQMETEIKSMPFIKTVFIRPSMLMGNRKEFRLGENIGKIFITLFGPLLIGKLKRYRGVSAEKVAKKLVETTINSPMGVVVIESENI